MKFCLLLLLTLTFVVSDEIGKDNNVYILTDDNFDEFIKTHDYVLVKFYCGHCKKLAPEFSKAAAVLEKENAYLAQVDCTTQKKLAGKFGIRGYPTIKFFQKGEKIDYKSGRKEAEIVNWVRKRATGQAYKEVTNKQELEDVKKSNEVFVAYFGDNEEDLKIYKDTAMEHDDFMFVRIKEQSLLEELKIKERSIVLFQKDSKEVMKGSITAKKIMDFAYGYSAPAVMEINDQSIGLIFGKGRGGLTLWRDSTAAKTKELDEIMTKIANEIRGVIPVIIADIKTVAEMDLAEYIKLKKEDLPKLKILDTKDKLKQYDFKGKITYEKVLKWVKKWENGKINDKLKSKPIPKEQTSPVFTLVGDNFYGEVFNNTERDVMVKFYAPWCGHCKRLAPVYEELAKKYKNNKNLLIAEFDATENEQEEVPITGYPTIYLWSAKDKENPIEFEGSRTVAAFEKFLNKNCKNPLVVEEKKSDL